MSDIVERLRERREVFWSASGRGCGPELRYGDAGDRLCREAADEIERLRAELALQKEKRTTPPTVSSVADGQPTCESNERNDSASHVTHIICDEAELAQRGEPVAHEPVITNEMVLVAREVVWNHGEVVPRTPTMAEALYAAMRAAPQQRKPLSQSEIIDATEHIDATRNGYFIHIARAIERKHGIE